MIAGRTESSNGPLAFITRRVPAAVEFGGPMLAAVIAETCQAGARTRLVALIGRHGGRRSALVNDA